MKRESICQVQEYTFRIISFRAYDVLVPFICHKCGRCCQKYAPQIPEDDLPRIAEYLKAPLEKIRTQFEECYMKKFTDTPDDCLFLNEKNQCRIYRLRPKACRLYPLDTNFGSAGVDCLGHAEFYRIVDTLFARRIYAAMWNPRDKNMEKMRAVPNREWPILWRKFIKAKPSNSMIRQFVKMNNVPKEL